MEFNVMGNTEWSKNLASVSTNKNDETCIKPSFSDQY
jgi:hypothetical protein